MSAMERVPHDLPRVVQGTRARRRSQPAADGEAGRAPRDARVGREPKQDSTQDLAARLREALASNTIGGRAGEESKWRGMADEVRQAQSSFARLVPGAGETGKQLAERFHKACNRFFDQYRRKVPADVRPEHSPQRGRPVGAR
jgi:hypothetical protein